MRKRKKNAQSIKTIILKFIYTIVAPSIIAWGIYLLIINLYFVNHTLSLQQTYMKNSAAVLDLALSNVDNLLVSVSNSTDIIDYLNAYTHKRDMLYVLVKTIHNYYITLLSSNSSAHSLKIYSKKEGLLYSPPFYPYADLDLSEKQKIDLDDLSYGSPLWVITPPSTSHYSNKFPTVRAYQKIYSFDSYENVGYIEVELKPNIVQNFFLQFDNSSLSYNANFSAFQDNDILYKTSDLEVDILEQITPQYLENLNTHTTFSENEYMTVETIDKLNLTLVLHGKITDLANFFPSITTLLIFIIFIALLSLVLFFFTNMNDLSKQILSFANYIKTSNPKNLASYLETATPHKNHYFELDTLIASYNSLINENTTLVSKVQMMELLNQDAKFQVLQSQIHPHFLYGTLENIRMLALQKKEMEIASLIFSLSSLFRNAINFSSEGVPLENELEIIHHYMSIQQYRFDDRLTYVTEIDPLTKDFLLPPFTLQPLVENAILYGVSNTLERCVIEVKTIHSKSLVEILISNTGALIEPQRLIEVNKLLSDELDLGDFKGQNNGYALYNIKERLKSFYKVPASIQMEVQNSHTIVKIVISIAEASDTLVQH